MRLLPDINILIYAFDENSESHAPAKAWLESALNGEYQIVTSSAILASVVRVTTGTAMKAPLDLVLAYVNALREAPAILVLEPGPRFWEIFEKVLRQSGMIGSLVSDVSMAALATEHDCTLVTYDRDFDRIPGLKLARPGQVTLSP